MSQRFSHLLLRLFLFAALPLAPQWAAAPRAPAASASPAAQDQDQDEVPVDERADIAKRLSDFSAQIKIWSAAKQPDPKPVIALIDAFLGDFDTLGPKDRASVVKGLAEVLQLKRLKVDAEGQPRVELHVTISVALGEMGPESVRPLASALGNKAFEKTPGVLVAMAQSLERLAHRDALAGILGLLSHRDLEVLAAAVRALGALQELEDKTKKEVFKRLLQLLVEYRKTLDKNPDDVDAHQNWGRVSGALVKSLASLSGHREDGVAAWQEWWKSNQKKVWG